MLIRKIKQKKKNKRKISTAQKMKFFSKDFFSKCHQIRSFLWIWSHLLKKSLPEKIIFFVVISFSVPVHQGVRECNLNFSIPNTL